MSLDELPVDLPIPEDDGACDHLENMQLPSIELSTTNNSTVDFSELNTVVIYIYPMTGVLMLNYLKDGIRSLGQEVVLLKPVLFGIITRN